MESQKLSLKDIHLPDIIGWWPPAMGWWMSAILVMLLIVFSVWLYKRVTRKTAVKSAKKILLALRKDNSLNDRDKLIALSELMRRVAVSVSPRSEVASLTGQAWLAYLNRTVSDSPFLSAEGDALAGAHYQKKIGENFKMTKLITICEQWILAQKENK